MITVQKEKLIREDIEKYLMGQVQLKDIASKRKVSLALIIHMEHKMVYEKIQSKLLNV